MVGAPDIGFTGLFLSLFQYFAPYIALAGGGVILALFLGYILSRAPRKVQKSYEEVPKRSTKMPNSPTEAKEDWTHG